MLKLLVCNNRRLTGQNRSCGARSEPLGRELEALLAEQRLPVKIQYSQCLSQCVSGPNMRLAPAGKFFHNVKADDLSEIIESVKHYIDSQERASAVAKEQ